MSVRLWIAFLFSIVCFTFYDPCDFSALGFILELPKRFNEKLSNSFQREKVEFLGIYLRNCRRNRKVREKLGPLIMKLWKMVVVTRSILYSSMHFLCSRLYENFIADFASRLLFRMYFQTGKEACHFLARCSSTSNKKDNKSVRIWEHEIITDNYISLYFTQATNWMENKFNELLIIKNKHSWFLQFTKYSNMKTFLFL